MKSPFWQDAEKITIGEFLREFCHDWIRAMQT
jgi:hypothetical protein